MRADSVRAGMDVMACMVWTKAKTKSSSCESRKPLALRTLEAGDESAPTQSPEARMPGGRSSQRAVEAAELGSRQKL